MTAATIALPKENSSRVLAGSKFILLDTVKALTFDGNRSILIPKAALAVSDPVEFPVKSGQVVTLSIFLRDGQTGKCITSHPGSRTETWISRGDHTNEESLTNSSTRSTFHWYFICGIEAWLPLENGTLVLIGDSLTDGRCSTDNYNNRWPDLLFNRMMEHPFARKVAVINQAAGGNRILQDENGPNVLSRIDRDVFGQPGVKYVMIFHGVNDIGTADPDLPSQEAIGDRLIQAYTQIVSRVHAFGIPVFCSTITPFSAPDSSIQKYSAASREQTRQRINNWMRTSGVFDDVVDFDAVLRDCGNHAFLNPRYNFGDFLHPNVEAFKAMADAFPIDIFQKFAKGVHTFN